MRDLSGDQAAGRVAQRRVVQPHRPQEGPDAPGVDLDRHRWNCLGQATPSSPILDVTRSRHQAVRRHGRAGRRRAGLRRRLRLTAVVLHDQRQRAGGDRRRRLADVRMHGDYVAPRVDSELSESGKSAGVSRHKVFMLSPDGTLQQWAPALETDQGISACRSLDGSSGTLEVGGISPRSTARPRRGSDIPRWSADTRNAGCPPPGGRPAHRFGGTWPRQGSKDFRVCCLQPISLVIARGRGHHPSNALRRLHRTCSPYDFRVDGHPQSLQPWPSPPPLKRLPPQAPHRAPAPHLAAADVNAAWQFPAGNWSSQNEAGRVDDIVRVGKRVFIGGNSQSPPITAERL